jgi:RNA recognition motif-containing protein
VIVNSDGKRHADDAKEVAHHDNGDEVSFAYPKSKIFVGGLDFKLTKEGLKEHFSQFGEVKDAIILNDIYTG